MVEPLVIDAIRPTTPDGFPAKGALGERMAISAAAYRDGHDLLVARARWRHANNDPGWQIMPMQPLFNDRSEAVIDPTKIGRHEFVIEAWTDRYGTWAEDIEIKAGAGQDIELELEEGARIVKLLAAELPEDDDRQPALAAAVTGLRDATRARDARMNAGLDDYVRRILTAIPDPRSHTESAPVPLWIDRAIARFSAWYEFFPRSEGGLPGARRRLPALADMGFDVVYLPPVHPIGHTFRKGRNNTLVAQPGDPGSPWAIG